VSGGQHIGKLSDSLVGDEDLEAARSSQAALKRLMKPATWNRAGNRDLGDGDVCPITPSHRRMYVSGKTQHCIHRDHDGYPASHPGGATDPTPFIWPSGIDSFPAAVKAYHSGTTKAAVEPSALPTLDITLEV